MLVLIDGVLNEVDNNCYVIKNGQRVSYHGSLGNTGHLKENSKLVSSGHLYVVNYNKDTFVNKFPLTFDEFKQNGDKF